MRRLSTADAGFDAAFRGLLNESRETTARVDGVVAAIIAAVRDRGDTALCDYTRQFDRQDLTPATLRVTADEIDAATAGIPAELAAALDLAAQRIEAFHQAQMPSDIVHTDAAGLTLGMRWTPLDAAGLYVPGGKAAYPSSVLMNALPARVAGVPVIAVDFGYTDRPVHEFFPDKVIPHFDALPHAVNQLAAHLDSIHRRA